MKFNLIETTIAKIHEAIRNGELTFTELVQAYIKRIGLYDKSSGLNTIIRMNPNALTRAKELDTEYTKTGKLKPLHGIPVVVKEHYHVKRVSF